MRGSTAIFIGITALVMLVCTILGVASFASRKKAERNRARDEERVAAATETKPTPKADAPVEPPPPAPQAKEPTARELWDGAQLRETVDSLLNAYQGNAVAADKKYKGKMVALIGVVQKIDVDPTGSGLLILKASTKPGGSDLNLGVDLEELSTEKVICRFDKAHTDVLGDVGVANSVAVVGVCQGRAALGGAGLDHSRLVQRAATPVELDKLLRQPPVRR